MLLVLGGCARHPDAPPHILLITLDTARADRFSYTGSSPVPTPNVDGLAADGTVFLEAVSCAPITLVTHASILTGLVPPAHGVRNNGSYRLTEEAVSIAELFKARGYRTAAFVGAAVLDARYGLSQGFDVYDDAVAAKPGAEFEAQRRAGGVVESALGWLGADSVAPTFVWVHLFDPHKPYDPPEPERSQYRSSPYDGEIAYSDRIIGRLLDGYRQRGLYDRTIVVFTSDHGEGLGDHGEMTHGVFLFDATVRVPLIVRVPGLGRGRVVSSQVQLVDLAPTLAVLGDTEPLPEVQGQSLVPLMRGEALPARPAYIETRLPLENYGWFALRGLRTESAKLVSGAGNELYDLKSDPKELNDVFARREETGLAMLKTLADDYPERPLNLAVSTEVDEATLRQLTALGYVSSGAHGSESAPPTYAESSMRLTRELYRRGLERRALERCMRIAEEEPAHEACMERLVGGEPGSSPPVTGSIPGREDPVRLVSSLEDLARRSSSEELRARLTALTLLLGEEGPAIDAFFGDGAGQKRRLEAAAALSRTGTICFENLDYTNAVHAYLIGLRLVPGSAAFHYNLGLAWERLGDMEEALKAFQKTVAIDAGFGRAEEHLRYAQAVVKRLRAARAATGPT